jgi:hypothetical protein
MELFWNLFWLAILIIPAIYLARIVLNVLMMIVVFTIGRIISLVEWLFNK